MLGYQYKNKHTPSTLKVDGIIMPASVTSEEIPDEASSQDVKILTCTQDKLSDLIDV